MPQIDTLGLLEYSNLDKANTSKPLKPGECVAITLYPENNALLKPDSVECPETIHVRTLGSTTGASILHQKAARRHPGDQGTANLLAAVFGGFGPNEIIWVIDTDATYIADPPKLLVHDGALEQYTPKLLSLIKALNDQFPVDLFGWEDHDVSGGYLFFLLEAVQTDWDREEFMTELCRHLETCWSNINSSQ